MTLKQEQPLGELLSYVKNKKPLLQVEDLRVSFSIQQHKLEAVRGISFSIDLGETVGLVGESGCGKTAAVQAITRLSSAGLIEGRALLDGQDLLQKTPENLRKVLGCEIGMVFQDPMSCLNPTMTIGRQIAEGLIYHKHMSKKEAFERAIELLHLVGVSEPELRIRQYPHHLSGGMRQRVLIAIAIACKPRLLIADEPTTALDVMTSAQILDLLRDLQKKLQTSLLLITHDLDVVASICDRVLVMYAGKIVEEGTTKDILQHPKHPYTQMLLQATNRTGLAPAKTVPNAAPLLEIRSLTKLFRIGKKPFPAVQDVSFDIRPGETLGLVGESGSGKSTLARLLLGLEKPTSGQILFNGKDISAIQGRNLYRNIQMIFQDPFASLNPRMTVGDLIFEPLLIHGLPDRTSELLDLVGLPQNSKHRFPHEFSGGQRQRIGIARALALAPKFLVCDEPISSLDVSIQAQIISLLLRLQQELGLTYLFIAHDLAMIRCISNSIAVMHQGHLVEIGPAEQIFEHPAHPYTKLLLSSRRRK